MKKLFIYTLILLLFGSIFSLAIQATRTCVDEAPVISSTIDLLSPSLLFAGDSTGGEDTLGDGNDPEPPPIN